ncbi:hypothetical protein [Arthrobacter sp. NicSoilC5]|uniref:hypothetical protein n=1 Tax=Arthrobacter sp. NicSoilC5 TaxID=2831000 RepID=UPI001CC80C6F|nr:hypothetical protein [Arthrobacter sp. NicSoilC5]BCW78865.1 hypothetical protein NicSoilC5_08840 [Arthrobacter sp. NicSoilC5]
MTWSTWAGMDTGALVIPPGSYRVRVCARGRDEGHAGELSEGTVDDYLVQLWPAPWQPDEVLQVRSHDANYWHEEVGSRPVARAPVDGRMCTGFVLLLAEARGLVRGAVSVLVVADLKQSGDDESV